MKLLKIIIKRIDTLTVIPNDLSFRIKGMPNPIGQELIVLNETKINAFNNDGFNHTVIVARHDEAFEIEQAVSNPLYMNYTYFGYFIGNDYMDNWRGYHQNKDPKVFIGGILRGFCISAMDEDAYYIYTYEIK